MFATLCVRAILGIFGTAFEQPINSRLLAPKEIGKLLFVQQFTESDQPTPGRPSEQLEFFFHITNWQDYQAVQLEATSHGVSEVMQCGFVSPVTTVILPRYLTEVDLGWLTDPATPTQILSELTS